MNSKDFIMVVDSEGRYSGNRNDGKYIVDFTSILSEKYAQYTVEGIFTTVPSFYTDVSGSTLTSYAVASVNIEFGTRALAYDASSNTTSSLVGIAHRQATSAATSAAYLSFDRNDSFPLVVSNPSSQIRVYITNLSTNTVFQQTSFNGTPQSDMSRWILSLKFSPVPESYIENF
jgi:hypothetical protein